jgi:SH3-like domain-containing protein
MNHSVNRPLNYALNHALNHRQKQSTHTLRFVPVLEEFVLGPRTLLGALALVLLFAGIVFAPVAWSQTAQLSDGPATELRANEATGSSGNPLPRFASVRAGEVNMRAGPGRRYPIEWVLTKRDQPVEIIDEHGDWRRVRDWQNDVGWVHRSMLRSMRTVIFARSAFMRRSDRPDAVPIAEIGPGVIAELLECAAARCRVDVDVEKGHYRGWAPTGALWGLTHATFAPPSGAIQQ